MRSFASLNATTSSFASPAKSCVMAMDACTNARPSAGWTVGWANVGLSSLTLGPHRRHTTP